ncbi:MAG: hypothetical protein K2F73_01995 [Ruminococcus sp.]|nr:hypothetical protein [Ruminococcus sp.]MDE6101738.1 hypothetical protein [Ruminococcus sp.]
MEEENKKPLSGLFKGVLIFFVVIFVVNGLLYGGFIFIITYNPHYTWFTKNRKARMEEKFSIVITDNIKLREYSEFEFLTQLDYTLYLDAYDLEKFMEENVNGTITEKYDENDFAYKGADGQKINVDVYKSDSKDNYSITLNISD